MVKQAEKKKPSRNLTKTAAGKKAMLEALAANMGFVHKSAKAAGVSPRSHQRWLKNDDDYRQAVADINYENLDTSEEELLKFVRGEVRDQTPKDQLTAIMYHLNNKGKERGYNQRIEVTGVEGKTLFPFSWDKALGAKNGNTDSAKN